MLENTSALPVNIASHPTQRVGIFIDTQNLYHSARIKFGSHVNYHEMIKEAVGGRPLIRAFAYVIKSATAEEEKFFGALEDIGIEIKVKDLQIFHTGEKKADWDVGIAVDVIRMTEKLDAIVLISGDGDFLEVIKYVKSRGVRTEVMAFAATTSAKLIEEADYFFDLGSQPERFLIGSGRPRRATNERYSNVGFGYPSFLKNRPFSSGNDANVPASGDVLYGKKPIRTIKPVVGLPVRKNILRRPQRHANPMLNAQNAFGNKPKAVRKKKPGSSGPVSSLFSF
jgi:uncharacterized LabA/DUF88 family protein